MRNHLLLILCYFIGGLSLCQGQEDSLYIRNYNNELQALSTIRYNQSRISIIGHPEGNLGFEQSGVSVGSRAQFDNWGLGVMVPTQLFTADRKGTSLGFHLQLFPKSLVINAGVNRLKGFQDTEVGKRYSSQQPVYQNIQMWHFYLNPVYAFSGDKFSLRSITQFTQRQLKSSGTVLASLRLEYLRLNNKTLLVETAFNSNIITGYDFRQNGIEAGYAYTFVFWKAAFITAMATGGVAHTKTSYNLDEEKFAYKQWQVVPVSDFKVSMGYNSDRYVGALQFNYRQRAIQSEDIQMEVNDWSVQFTFGVRLYAPHIRRKLDQHGARFAKNFVPVRE